MAGRGRGRRDGPAETAHPLARFGPEVRAWFEASFAAPSPVQAAGWPRIASGDHVLLSAPTGSGKTLAAFLWAIDALLREPPVEAGVRVLYVSPLKALAADIERNLRAPLEGVRRAAEGRGEAPAVPRVALRTGDTPARERRAQSRNPAEILVTTPESLYLILGSAQRATLATVQTVIVDEIHALAPGKRGAHLALSLERVARLTAERGIDPQRIGLSATARPLDEVARFLGGDRPVALVDALEPPALDLEVRGFEWDALAASLLGEIRAHSSTLVFTNSRGLCERLARELNEASGEELCRAHHGSVAPDERREAEAALAAGGLAALVATHSLELGIDMQAVDCVLLVESPGSVARGLQRVGRAGHRLGAPSRGRFFPKHAGDLLESAAVVRGMHAGRVEALRVPQQPLDVLAQQIVAHCSAGAVELTELEALIQRSYPFRDLTRDTLTGVLDMLSGRYPSTDFAELRPRLVWDRARDRLEGRPGSRLLALVSGGTIPDRGLYPVFRAEGGPRVGELDEEMVHETRAGDVIALGATSWRVDEIGRDRVLVSPAPGEPGRLPFWRGEGPGRPVELGRALGALTRELGELGPERAVDWLREHCDFDARAARELADTLAAQQRATGQLPSDTCLVVERFRDELGDWRICILSPFGARLHAPWALALQTQLAPTASAAAQTHWSDAGISLRLPDAEAEPIPVAALLPDPDQVEAWVVEALGDSALFAGQFRENAARALLLPRRRPGVRTPLWSQRLRAQNLLAVARDYPAFPILLETYRACLRDVFDLPALTELLRDTRRGAVRVHDVTTRSPSPLARALAFEYTAAYLYRGDTPAAERRSAALRLDRAQLRELLGDESLRELLDVAAVEAVEGELQGRAAGFGIRGPEGVWDRLRQEGELSEPELAARCQGAELSGWLAELEAAGRIARVQLGGVSRFIAAEDAGLYADAFEIPVEGRIPKEFRTSVAKPLQQWLIRYAACRGPFTASAAAERCGLPPAEVEAGLKQLAEAGRLECGALDPRRTGTEPDWCDREVLRRLRRRSLATLRAQVEPVDSGRYARFLAEWQGVGPSAVRGGDSRTRLRAALEVLEGYPVALSELETAVLPARVPDYDPRDLDELGTAGEFVWVGAGALGARDGRVRIFRREHAADWLDAAAADAPVSAEAREVLALLERRGACFSAELAAELGRAAVADLFGALRELAWSGHVTNDAFAALRALAAPAPRAARARSRKTRPHPLALGRWSAVSRLGSEPRAETRRAHRLALKWLERYGVVGREVAAAEEQPGGFAALGAVYREMERAGRVRGGQFVADFRGLQFAWPGAVDRLRSSRPASARAVLLAATDPANPFGALLPWPAGLGEPSPRRQAGVRVVLVEGEPVLVLDAGGRRLRCGADGACLDAGLTELARAGAAGRRPLRIEQIDGESALASPLAPHLERVGFRRDYRALVLERPIRPADVV